MAEELKVLKIKVNTLEEDLREVNNNMEDSIAIKVKEAVEKAMISITSDNNQKIQEEVAKRMEVIENNSTQAAVPDPKKPFKCPKCVWRGKIQAAVKAHMTKYHK